MCWDGSSNRRGLRMVCFWRSTNRRMDPIFLPCNASSPSWHLWRRLLRRHPPCCFQGWCVRGRIPTSQTFEMPRMRTAVHCRWLRCLGCRVSQNDSWACRIRSPTVYQLENQPRRNCWGNPLPQGSPYRWLWIGLCRPCPTAGRVPGACAASLAVACWRDARKSHSFPPVVGFVLTFLARNWGLKLFECMRWFRCVRHVPSVSLPSA